MMKKQVTVYAVLIGQILFNISYAGWKQTGPEGGTVRALAVSGVNVFAGTEYGGVYML
ncbi:MAG: hypothetical protein GXY77_02030 [Fibrobacter sp.]|nr:hypothetical protein [Fibrobacter sp.]